MSKKTGKKGTGSLSGSHTKWWIAALVVLVLGGLGLYLGGGIELTPSKVTISPAPPKDAASGSVVVEQKAVAEGESARAANAAGDLTKGRKATNTGASPAAAKVASKELRQEAAAAAKNSSALNAGGDLNVD